MPTDDATPSAPARRILVAGLGNELLRDDGVGVHVAREVRRRLSGGGSADPGEESSEALPEHGVCVVDVGTSVLDALHLFAWADRVLAVDALQAGRRPGTVYSFTAEDVADNGPQASLHEMGMVATLRFLPASQRPAVSLIGVEPAVIDYGLELTPEVQAALPAAAAHVCRLVEEWQTPAGAG
jgi:hydrogenase maturation protease